MDLDWAVELKATPKGRKIDGIDYYATEAKAKAAAADLRNRGFVVGEVIYKPGIASSSGFGL